MRWICLVAILLMATQAWADTLVTAQLVGNGCRMWKLCDNQTVAGECDDVGNATGGTYVIRAGNEVLWSAWADESGDTAGWTLKIYDRTQGSLSGSQRALLNGTGDIEPDTPRYKHSWLGICGDIHAEVSGAPGTGGVDLWVKGCPYR